MADQILDVLNDVLMSAPPVEGDDQDPELLEADSLDEQDEDVVTGDEPEDSPEEDDTLFDGEADSGDPESLDPEDPQETPKAGRASKRIRQLVDQNKDLRGEMDQLRQGVQQMARGADQRAQASMHEYQQKVGQYIQSLEQKLEEQAENKKFEADDSEEGRLAKFKHDFLRGDVTPAMRKILAEELGPVKQNLEYRDQQARAAARKAENEAILVRLEEQSRTKAAGTLNRHIEGENEALVNEASSWLLNASAAHRKAPEVVAPEFEKFLDSYYDARKKGEMASRKRSLAKGKKVPAPARRGQSGARGSAKPQFSRDDVHKAGYSDWWEASRDNFARIARGGS